MSPRKRARRDDPGGCSTNPAAMPLQPSQAKSTSALSNLSATPSAPASTAEPARVMPPPSLPQLDTSNKSDKSSRSSISTQQGGKLVCFGSLPPGCLGPERLTYSNRSIRLGAGMDRCLESLELQLKSRERPSWEAPSELVPRLTSVGSIRRGTARLRA